VGEYYLDSMQQKKHRYICYKKDGTSNLIGQIDDAIVQAIRNQIGVATFE